MILFSRNLSRELCVVAEIGVNHEGSLSKAKDLIYSAWEAGADAAKLQSYTLARYCSPKDVDRYARLRSFQLSMKDHEDLFGWAAKEGGNLFSTPVTEDWVEYLAAKSGVIKVASGDSTFWPTLEAAAHSGAKILLSTGATTVLEMDEIVQNLSAVIDRTEFQERLILLHCVSSYPASPREANFGAIRFIRERYGLETGFSSHFVEAEVPLAAVACGASVLEVHVTDKREGRTFRDHALSFEPADLQRLIDKAREFRAAALVQAKEVQPSELQNVPYMRKGLVAARQLVAGEIIHREDLQFARCEGCLPWSSIEFVIGRRLLRPVPPGFPLEADAFDHADAYE